MTSSPIRSLEQIAAEYECARNAPERYRQAGARRLSEQLAKAAQERGLTPMLLEPETLLRRVRALDWSSEFLGKALISAYWKDEPFNRSLHQLINLDAEGIRLFHQILHIRMIPGWRDAVLYTLACEISDILAEESRDVSSTDE